MTDVVDLPTHPTLRDRWNRLTLRVEGLIGHSFIALLARFAIAAIFFQSGRTKVVGFLTLTDNTYQLFQDEYKIPLVPPEIAAHMAAYAETFVPMLLVLGLCTRLSALALLGMTTVIEIFVYPDAWPTHLSWAALLIYLVARGGGAVSVDRAIGIR
jgi:putative oxidoreductase